MYNYEIAHVAHQAVTCVIMVMIKELSCKTTVYIKHETETVFDAPYSLFSLVLLSLAY